MKQDSKEWHEWRGKGLGASDIPVVLDISPFKSRFELWCEKTGIAKSRPFHPRAVQAMERGKFLEPIAREKYESKIGKEAPAVNFTHPEYEFLRASLDGWIESERVVVEIKAPGKVDQGVAKKGHVPKKYLAQMQAQMLVTGASKGHYVSYDGKQELIILEVPADFEAQAEILAEAESFWEMVLQKIPPPTGQKDLKRAVGFLKEQLLGVEESMTVLEVLSEAA